MSIGGRLVKQKVTSRSSELDAIQMSAVLETFRAQRRSTLRGFATRCAESIWLSGQVAYFSRESLPLFSARPSLSMFLCRLERKAKPDSTSGGRAALMSLCQMPRQQTMMSVAWSNLMS
jgi:hypothetical protein